MSEEKIYDVPANFTAHTLISEQQYQEMYRQSVDDPDAFWSEQAKTFLHWDQPWSKVVDWDFHTADIRWFEGAKLNVSYNCLDRHLEKRGDQTAIIWEGDDPGEDKHISYRQLHAEVCKFANGLKSRGVKKGDRVCIYMPMVLTPTTWIMAA